jgi:hypothetical protein
LKTKSSGKSSFIGLNERQVLRQVGRFGEEIAAALLDGEMVSDHSEATPFADVVNRKIGLAVQVKMCNGRHAQRPLPKQVVDLFNEIEEPFLFNKGVYAFIFYIGIYNSKKKNNAGKSKIWSRKFSRGMRREIIAKELQYIYIIDVRLLRYMAHRPEFMKEGANLYVPEEKPTRGRVLYLNRTFMKGFREMRESHRELLDVALGRDKWAVKTVTKKFRFTEGVPVSFERSIPVYVVGTKRTVRAAMSVLNDRLAPIPLEHTKTANIFAVKPS